jgi:hypothetical protein
MTSEKFWKIFEYFWLEIVDISILLIFHISCEHLLLNLQNISYFIRHVRRTIKM